MGKNTLINRMNNFQTPIWCCKYMKSLIPKGVTTVLEPTAGEGNLVNILKDNYEVISPKDFWKLKVEEKFDCIVMNPPFTPMSLGYKILYQCMKMSDNIIALMPWLVLINSEKRTKDIFSYGLKSVTHLPRNTFPGARVQTCILQMKRLYKNDTIFKHIKTKEKCRTIDYWLRNTPLSH